MNIDILSMHEEHAEIRMFHNVHGRFYGYTCLCLHYFVGSALLTILIDRWILKTRQRLQLLLSKNIETLKSWIGKITSRQRLWLTSVKGGTALIEFQRSVWQLVHGKMVIPTVTFTVEDCHYFYGIFMIFTATKPANRVTNTPICTVINTNYYSSAKIDNL